MKFLHVRKFRFRTPDKNPGKLLTGYLYKTLNLALITAKYPRSGQRKTSDVGR